MKAAPGAAQRQTVLTGEAAAFLAKILTFRLRSCRGPYCQTSTSCRKSGGRSMRSVRRSESDQDERGKRFTELYESAIRAGSTSSPRPCCLLPPTRRGRASRGEHGALGEVRPVRAGHQFLRLGMPCHPLPGIEVPREAGPAARLRSGSAGAVGKRAMERLETLTSSAAGP